MFGVTVIAAHIPLTDRAVLAGNRVGLPHDADDEIAVNQRAVRRRLLDNAERFVADDQALVAWWRVAVFSFNDLMIGAADPERRCSYENGATVARGYLELLEPNGVGDARRH